MTGENKGAINDRYVAIVDPSFHTKILVGNSEKRFFQPSGKITDIVFHTIESEYGTWQMGKEIDAIK